MPYDKNKVSGLYTTIFLLFSNHRRCFTSYLMTQILRFVIAITFMISGISKGANIESTSQLIVR